MNEQLLLLRSGDHPWRLDEHTREIGRQGIAQARAALRLAAGESVSRPTPSRPGQSQPGQGRPRRRIPAAA